MEDRIPGYVIDSKIGEGGMGRIYRAHQEGTGRQVAIKVMAPDQWAVRENRGRFLRESILLSTLRHPNICQLVDSGETEAGRYFFATELLTGETLQQRLFREDLALEKSLDIGIQVARGLEAAHRQGVYHRDVKPANLMLTSGRQVKILDFGLAKLEFAAGVSLRGEVLGTPVYAAPEQLRGEECDFRVDLWGLGVVLYEMISGIVPFPGPDTRSIGKAVLTKKPVGLRKWHPEAPEALERTVHRALAKDREARHGSAEELAEELSEISRWIESGPEDGPPPDLDEGRSERPAGADAPGWIARVRRWLG